MKGLKMSRMVLGYDPAHEFVEQQARMGNDVRWEGWDMVFFKPTDWGFSNTAGAFHKGRWGMESRITADSKGNWNVPAKYIRKSR